MQIQSLHTRKGGCFVSTIQVRFIEEMGGYDIFRPLHGSEDLTRIPLVKSAAAQWGRVEICGKYVEPSAPLPEGLSIQVMGDRKQILFIETLGKRGIAPATGKSSAEYELLAAEQFRQAHQLLSYEEWSTRLLSLMPVEYPGYDDTWLFCEGNEREKEIVQPVRILGKLLYISRHTYSHSVCGTRWSSFLLQDRNLLEVRAICGYQIY